MFGGDDSKRLVAHFPRAVSVYEGSEVRVLGVAIGTVGQVTPSGTDVEVTMSYDADVDLPADAKAAIVAPSIVGDRFVQVTPVFEEGDEVMADNTELAIDRRPPSRSSSTRSSRASTPSTSRSGPTAPTRTVRCPTCSPSRPTTSTARAPTFNSTLKNFARLTDTLANNKEELFGSAEQLGKFIETLAENDETVRGFNQSLADVSGLLKGEREELVGLAEEPVDRADRGVVVRHRQPRDPGPQHHGPQPGVQGAGQAARRAGHGPQGRARSPSTTWR